MINHHFLPETIDMHKDRLFSSKNTVLYMPLQPLISSFDVRSNSPSIPYKSKYDIRAS